MSLGMNFQMSCTKYKKSRLANHFGDTGSVHGRKYSHQPLADNNHQTSIRCARKSLTETFNPADYPTQVYEELQRL
jgi:hypothetical protein